MPNPTPNPQAPIAVTAAGATAAAAAAGIAAAAGADAAGATDAAAAGIADAAAAAADPNANAAAAPPTNRLSVVVVAAGRSSRMGDTDKTFAPIHGAPLIVHTLRNLATADVVDRIVLVVAADSIARARSLADAYAIPKIAAICPGGARRQDSVYAGLRQLPDCQWVAIHDGARPNISPELLDTGLSMAQQWGAAIAAVPVKDTIKVVNANGLITDTPPRATLWAAQTPQIFDYHLLLSAHQSAAANPTADYTDDAAMLEAIGRPVAIFPGAYNNLKVTTPDDLTLMEQLLAAPTTPTP